MLKVQKNPQTPTGEGYIYEKNFFVCAVWFNKPFPGLYSERSSSKMIKAVVETGGCLGVPFLIGTDKKEINREEELLTVMI